MSTQEQANITNNDNELFRPHLQRAKNIVLGYNPPGLFTQIVFFIGIIGTSIFGIWNTLSYFILKTPLYLKRHKQVDVEAIVELRGKELGFEGDQFYNSLELFHFTGIFLWLSILIGFIFLWRQKKWSAYLIIGALILYCAFMAVLLGITYFVEDTTLFDKLTLLILLVFVLTHHFIIGSRKFQVIN